MYKYAYLNKMNRPDDKKRNILKKQMIQQDKLFYIHFDWIHIHLHIKRIFDRGIVRNLQYTASRNHTHLKMFYLQGESMKNQ